MERSCLKNEDVCSWILILDVSSRNSRNWERNDLNQRVQIMKDKIMKMFVMGKLGTNQGLLFLYDYLISNSNYTYQFYQILLQPFPPFLIGIHLQKYWRDTITQCTLNSFNSVSFLSINHQTINQPIIIQFHNQHPHKSQVRSHSRHMYEHSFIHKTSTFPTSRTKTSLSRITYRQIVGDAY